MSQRRRRAAVAPRAEGQTDKAALSSMWRERHRRGPHKLWDGLPAQSAPSQMTQL